MSTWPEQDNFNTSHTDSPTDDPSQARQQINQAMLDLKDVIASHGEAGGVSPLDDGAKVPLEHIPVIPIELGGTGATDAAAALVALGAEPAIGHETVNKAGDTMGGVLYGPEFVATGNESIPGRLTSKITIAVPTADEITLREDLSKAGVAAGSANVAAQQTVSGVYDSENNLFTDVFFNWFMSLPIFRQYMRLSAAYLDLMSDIGLAIDGTEVISKDRVVDATGFKLNGVPVGSTTDHNVLAGLNTGDLQHLTAAQLTGLVTGVLTSLHKHAAADVAATTTNLAHALAGLSDAQAIFELLDDRVVKIVTVADAANPTELDSIPAPVERMAILTYKPGVSGTMNRYTAGPAETTNGAYIRPSATAGISWKGEGPLYDSTVLKNFSGGAAFSGALSAVGMTCRGGDFSFYNTSATTPRNFYMTQYASTAGNGVFVHARRARGSSSTPTAIITGDPILIQMAEGHDGTTLGVVATRITHSCQGTIATGKIPGKITTEIADANGAMQTILTQDATGNTLGGDTTVTGSLKGERTGLAFRDLTTYVLDGGQEALIYETPASQAGSFSDFAACFTVSSYSGVPVGKFSLCVNGTPTWDIALSVGGASAYASIARNTYTFSQGDILSFKIRNTAAAGNSATITKSSGHWNNYKNA